MNKYKLINKTTGEAHICEKVAIDGWDYYVSDETVGNYHWYINTFLNKLYHSSTLKPNENSKKVIATNNPSIDIPKVVDEDEKIALMAIRSSKKFASKSESDYTLGFIAGYKESQETHPFSEEDMIEFSEWLDRNTYVFDGSPTLSKNGKSIGIAKDKLYCRVDYTLSDNNCGYTTKELLQLWKEQRTKTLYYEKIT